jgi:hypothetical protein
LGERLVTHLRWTVVRAALFSRVGGLGSLLLVVGACGVGERPTLAEPTAVGGLPGTPTGVEAADAVLSLLEGEPPAELTATYAITTKFGGATTDATVVLSGGESSVTVGDVRFLTDGDAQTCDLAAGTCEDGDQEARISDTGLSSHFYATSPAQALRVALSRASGEPEATSQTVGERPVTCVTVPSGQGDELTCAAPEGVVALWDTAAVTVRLQSIQQTADPAAFETSG